MNTQEQTQIQEIVTRLNYQDYDKCRLDRLAVFRKESFSSGLLRLTEVLKQADQNE